MTTEDMMISDDEIENMLWSAINDGAALKDIHDISGDMMENIYAHAYQFYHQGRLDDAERFFSFLCMYDLSNTDYFIGLGAVYQLKKNYNKACDIYALAYVMGKDNLDPVFFSGQCQLLMGNFVKAMQCFDLVCKRAKDVKLVNKALIYLETIKNKSKETIEE